jgi:hypothetical protein
MVNNGEDNMTKFNVGDTVKCLVNSSKALTKGLTYTVIDGGHYWVDVRDDCGDTTTVCPSNFELVVTNELKVGETYTSYNGDSWVAIYEEDDLVWMKSGKKYTAHPYNKNGVAFSLNSEYDINWEVTKEPIIKEGVLVSGGYHLSAGLHPMYTNKHNLTVTTVDGVPDWTTLACKENN